MKRPDVEIVVRGSYALREEIVALLDELGLNVVTDRGLQLGRTAHDSDLAELEQQQTPIRVIVRDAE